MSSKSFTNIYNVKGRYKDKTRTQRYNRYNNERNYKS